MTKGIKVIWLDENDRIDEIEYFCGIDIDDLHSIPEFTSVRADWPRYEPRSGVEYQVDARFERPGTGKVHLVVDYDPARNPELSRGHPEIIWGTNTIILNQGSREGHCEWLARGSPQPERVRWEAFDIEQSRGRPLSTYQGSRRQSQFRRTILACDGHRCVLTRETTERALEAAHLIPARNGENDFPFNGVALRADLHRLFDDRLFTFRDNGWVTVTDPSSSLSNEYRTLLRNKRLPAPTFQRVRPTLSAEQFRTR